jgi:hypothetical protein
MDAWSRYRVNALGSSRECPNNRACSPNVESFMLCVIGCLAGPCREKYLHIALVFAPVESVAYELATELQIIDVNALVFICPHIEEA